MRVKLNTRVVIERSVTASEQTLPLTFVDTDVGVVANSSKRRVVL